MITARSSGWSAFTVASARSMASKRFTGTSRPTATTRGAGDRCAAGRVAVVDPRRGHRHPIGGAGRGCSTISARDDSDSVTMRLER